MARSDHKGAQYRVWCDKYGTWNCDVSYGELQGQRMWRHIGVFTSRDDAIKGGRWHLYDRATTIKAKDDSMEVFDYHV